MSEGVKPINTYLKIVAPLVGMYPILGKAYLPPEPGPIGDVGQSLHVKVDPRLVHEAELEAAHKGQPAQGGGHHQAGVTLYLDVSLGQGSYKKDK